VKSSSSGNVRLADLQAVTRGNGTEKRNPQRAGATGAAVGPYLSSGKMLGQRYPSDVIFALAGDKLQVASGVLLEEARQPFDLYVTKATA